MEVGRPNVISRRRVRQAPLVSEAVFNPSPATAMDKGFYVTALRLPRRARTGVKSVDGRVGSQ